MKKYVIVLAASIASFAMNAQNNPQGPGGPRQRMDPQQQGTRMTDKMTKDLGLSDDQKAKVLPINTDAAQKMQDLRAKGGQGVNMRDERAKIEQDKDAKLKGVLTDAQYQKYVQMREEAQQKRKAGGGNQPQN